MDKKLKAYTTFLQTVSSRPTPELIKYHREMLQQFQHERLIHLIVTMSFALFMIIFLIFTTALFILVPTSLWGNIICYSAAAITLALFITTLFYIRHYYKLENGVQKLEALTSKLHKIA